MRKICLVMVCLFCIISCVSCNEEQPLPAHICEENPQENSGQQLSIEVKSITIDLEFNIDELLSMQNSNHVNLGYLCTDGGDNIYYINPQENAIYESDLDGQNDKRLYVHTDYAIKYLQIYEEYLYFHTAEGIWRLNISTEECLNVFSGSHGEFRVYKESLYINTSRGIIRADLDGAEEMIIFSDNYYPVLWNFADNMLVGVAASNSNTSLFSEGCLLVLDIETGKVNKFAEGMANVVAVGNRLTYLNQETERLHIFEKGITYELGYHMEHSFKAIGNKDMVYFMNLGFSEVDMCDVVEICTWDGKEVKRIGSILQTEESIIKGFYIAKDYLYVLEQRSNNWIWHYYQISTGILGVL